MEIINYPVETSSRLNGWSRGAKRRDSGVPSSVPKLRNEVTSEGLKILCVCPKTSVFEPLLVTGSIL
jgi:hypothetical protein